MRRSDSRLGLLQERMAGEGVDLTVLAPGAHMQWLLGFCPHGDERPCLLCATPGGAAFLMPALNAESAREHTALPFYEWPDAGGPEAAFRQLLEELDARGTRSLVIDETMRADFAALVQDALPSANRQFTASTVGLLRMRKDEEECVRLRKSAAIADWAMQAGWEAMKPGASEEDVARAIQGAFAGEGAKPLFCIVGAAGNGAFPHHQTGGTALSEGDVVVIDTGGGLDGYSSDITRVAVLGTPPEEFAVVAAIVERAVQAALAAARPGARAKDVDAAARGVITEAGYGEYFLHRTGHGLGVEVHEPPYLTSVSETVLEPGMVFSIEPGIYLPERFGVRLEEIVILHEHGPEVLSGLSRDPVRL